MRARSACIIAALVAMAALTPAASAHERYFSEDDAILIILGEQNEPVYTYDWTNLDFFVRDNATGEGIPGVEQTVTATLIAPNGAELDRPIEPQFGATGEYAFVEDYLLTMPGQYQVRLDGSVNGTDISGTYLLPGPRGDMGAQAFPLPIEHDLLGLAEANSALEDEVADLEDQIAELETRLAALEDDDSTNDAPALSLLPLIGLLGLLALTHRRRA